MTRIEKQKVFNLCVQMFPKAEAAAIKAGQDNPEDGGTCNMDSVMINFKGWGQEYIDELTEITGIEIGQVYDDGAWKNHAFVRFTENGQGNLRNRMVEAANKVLRDAGINSTIFYQMD